MICPLSLCLDIMIGAVAVANGLKAEPLFGTAAELVLGG